MIIATTALNSLSSKRYDTDWQHLVHAPVTTTIGIAFNCQQQLCHRAADQRPCSTRARRTCMQHTYCPQQHTCQLAAQAQQRASTTQRLHMCMCAAVQRPGTCAAADGRSDLLLLAAQHSAAALVAERMWLAGSECCSQLRVLMLQVRSTSSARVAGAGVVPRRGCSAAAPQCAARVCGGQEVVVRMVVCGQAVAGRRVQAAGQQMAHGEVGGHCGEMLPADRGGCME